MKPWIKDALTCVFVFAVLVLAANVASSYAIVNAPTLTVSQSDLIVCADGTTAPGRCAPGNEPAIGGEGDPVLFYSDITSGPKTGWDGSPTEGAVVTVWGRNLGAESSRGSNYVTVNGVNLTDNSDYLDTWAERGNPTPWQESITFQLNSSMTDGAGTIAVTVGGVTSNTLPFTIRAGNIYFVDDTAPTSGTTGTLANPFHCEDFKTGLVAGDIVYFRGGTYSSMCNGGKSVIWVRDTDAAGTAANPISLVAYPNEDVYIDGLTNGDTVNFNKGIVLDAPYWHASKFRIAAVESAIRGDDYSRIIGNDLIGTTQFHQGAGIISSNNDGQRLYGNAIHGGRSQNKLDHAIYFSGCNPNEGSEAAYNWIYDNDFRAPTHPTDPGYGSLIVDNHQVDRCASNERMMAQRVYNNLIDCSNYYARAIGFYDSSWDTGEAQEPQPALAYNNIVVGCGVPSTDTIPSPTAYHNNGHAVFFNNTFLNSNGNLDISGSDVLSTAVSNNVFTHSGVGTPGTCNDSDATTNTNNLGHVCTAIGTGAINQDPLITFNPNDLYNPVVVAANSPVIDAGVDTSTATVNADTFTMVERDFYGKFRSGTFDIGAVEYAPLQPQGIVFETDFSNDGSYYQQNAAFGAWTAVRNNVPEGIAGVVAENGGKVYGVPGSGVDGGVAMKFEYGLSSGSQNIMFVHLTGDQDVGYDELYVRYKVRLPNGLIIADPALDDIPYWKWLRLWQNTDSATTSGWSENRADSGYVVANFSGTATYGVMNDIVVSAAVGDDLALGSNGGERYSTKWYTGIPADFTQADGYFNVLFDFDQTTRELTEANQTWHTVEYRFKLASSPTANDGIVQVWYDGVEQIPPAKGKSSNAPELADLLPGEIPTAPIAPSNGWNMLSVFDNQSWWHHSWDTPHIGAGETRTAEQIKNGIFLNDIVVSTQRIGHDYVAGSVQ